MTDAHPVAIIGMAGTFPGAPSLAALHDLVFSRREGIADLDPEHVAAARAKDAWTQSDRRWIAREGSLDDIDWFDHDRFGITPREAELMDPQHRLVLQLCHEAIEDAGLVPGKTGIPVGVFVGCSINSYLLNVLLPSVGSAELQDDLRAVTGNDRDYLATRVAFRLNLRGPALTVQSACSTSLSTIHLAVEAIRSGRCDMALAGAACLRFPHRAGAPFREGGILSPDGRCRPFSAGAQGTVLGSGGGIVLLKSLPAAQRDGDPVRAVILGTAMANDGAHRPGFAAPSPEGQAKVIADALARAGVDARSIGYVEAHGTATPLGDRVELSGLTRAFRTHTDAREFCALGSVKANIGHLDGASGIAGLANVVGAFARRMLPPSPHDDPVNAALNIGQSPFRLPGGCEPWPAHAHRRRAGISSFGIGGTNVHLILEEPPESERRPDPNGPHLLCLSARSAAGVVLSAHALADHLAADTSLRLDDVSWTLAVGRAPEAYRFCMVVDDRDSAIAQLRRVTDGGIGHVDDTFPVRLHWICPASSHSAAAEALSTWDAAFAADMGEGLALVSAASPRVWSRVRWIAFLAALGRMLERRGMHPNLVAGDNDGLFAAAHLGGAMSLAEAMRAASGDYPVLDGDTPNIGMSLRRGVGPLEINDLLAADADRDAHPVPTLDVGAGFTLSLDDIQTPVTALSILGAAWKAGVAVDLALACAAPMAQRVALPPSHAERSRFFPDRPKQAPAPMHVPCESVRMGHLTWRPAPDSPPATASDERWLVVNRHGPADPGLLQAARRAGIDIDIADTQSPLLSLHDHSRVVLIEQGDGTPDAPPDTATFHALATYGRELLGRPRPPHAVIILTQGLVSIAGESRYRPEAALLLGITDGLRGGNRAMQARCVDVGTDVDPACIVDEIARDGVEGLVALRGADRWLLDIQAPRPLKGPTRLKPGGTYLITGGLGELGLRFAIMLVRDVGARVALMCRRLLPTHDRLIGLSDDHPLVRRARLYQRLLDTGTRPVLVMADLADPGRVSEAVDKAAAELGGLDGVIHAAGEAPRGSMVSETRHQADAVLRPKVAGTYHLLEALKPHAPRFVVLCGSLATWHGGYGQASYVAANAYLDAVALAGGTGDTEVMSIAWDRWRGAGLAATTALHDYAVDPHDWITDEYRNEGRRVIPGTALLDLALLAMERERSLAGLAPAEGFEMEDIAFVVPCRVPDRMPRLLQVALERTGHDTWAFRVQDRTGAACFARGRISLAADGVSRPLPESYPACPATVPPYPPGQTRGRHWQVLHEVRHEGPSASAELKLDETLAVDVARYALHPSLVDAAMSFAAGIFAGRHLALASISRLRTHRRLAPRASAHAVLHDASSGDLEVSVFIMAVNGWVEIEGAVFHPTERRDADMLANAGPGRTAAWGIDPDEGASLLRTVLQSLAGPRVAVMHEAPAGLPTPAASEATIDQPPSSPAATQDILLALWERVLRVENIGMDDDLFALGADSLSFIEVIAGARTHGIVMSPNMFPQHPTIRGMSAACRAAVAEGTP